MTNNSDKNIEKIKNTIWDSVKKLKEARKQIGWSIAELSRQSGVSVGVISDLENSKGKVPSLANFIALTRTLKMSEAFVIKTIQGECSSTKRKTDEKELEYTLINCLRDYGLYDENSTKFIFQAIEFAKSRKPSNSK